MTDDTIRMRATLEDDTSGSLARIRRNMKAVGSDVDTSRARREFSLLTRPIKEVTDRMTGGMLPSFSAFKLSAASVALVAVGTGYAMSKLAQNLREFSDRNADLKYSAQSLGFTTQSLRAFQRAAGEVMIRPDQALAGLQTFVKNAEDFRLRTGALREELHSLAAGDLVEAIARTKNNMEALRLAFERMQQLKARDPAIAKRFAESMFGMSEATRMTWEQFQKANSEMAKSGTFTTEQIEQSEKFREQWKKMADTVEDATNRAKFALMGPMTTALKGVNAILDVTVKSVEKLIEFFSKPTPEVKPGDKGGWNLPHMYRKPTSGTNEELQKFSDLLRKANFQLEAGQRGGFGGGSGGGVINAAYSPGGGVGGGGGGRGWGGGGYTNIPSSALPSGGGGGRSSLGGGGGGGRSMIPSDGEIEAANKRWWGGDQQGETSGGGGGADFLKKMRAPLAQQSDDPSTRRLLRGVLSSENPGAGPAVIESLANRTQLVNEARAKKGLPPLTLRDMILGHRSIGGGKSFYGPVRTGAINSHMARADRDPAYAAKLDKNIDLALKGGSNWIKGHTDQGSAGDPNYHSGGVGVNINRERFNDWGYPGARAFRERLMAEYNKSPGMGGSASASIDRSMIDSAVSPPQVNATGSVNLTVNAPAGTKVAASSTGMFQETQVRRQKQMVGPDEFD